MTLHRLKKIAVLVVKLGISLALLKVVFDLGGDASFAALRDQPKDWGLLALAWPFVLAAVLLTFLRWMVLVRALGIPFGLGDAMRLGFLGYMFNYVSLGSVGGDLFKAVFIAREHPEHRAEAVATVVVDRIMGLYGLFVVAALAVLWTGLYADSDATVRYVARAALWCAAGGAAGGLLLMIPALTGVQMAYRVSRLPGVGATALKLLLAARAYREQWGVVLAGIVMSMGVHALMATAIYLMGRALPGATPDFADYFLIVPLSLLAAATPLPLAGLGAFEAMLEFLYSYIGASAGVAKGQGFVLALCYRIMTLLIVPVGIVYYYAGRHDVSEAMHEAELEAEGA